MIRPNELYRLLGGAACVIALSACSTAPVKPPASLPLDKTLAAAAEASRAGQKTQALGLLQQASADHPADKAPWLQKAQIRFEGGQYGEAILDAQQVLARDPTNTVANSIVAISGLRLSTAAISDLVRQNNLTGTTRSESQELAKLLRESVGESQLFTTAPPPKPKAIVPPVRPKAKTGAAAKDAGDSASPFDALK